MRKPASTHALFVYAGQARKPLIASADSAEPAMGGRGRMTDGRRQKMDELRGRVAIVTGAGQGVGRGIALALASAGASLVLTGRTRAKLEQVAAEIDARGSTALPIVCDGKFGAQVRSCVERSVECFGRLDILVNNAQESPLGSLLEVSEDALHAGWESGPLAAFRFMKACYPHLRDGGVIINVGSGTSANPMPIGRGVYSAIKAAIVTLSRTAAVEWGVEGIRSIAIMPAVSSPAAVAWSKAQPDAFARSIESIPLRRLGDAEADVGRAVAFLCGPDAGYITGTCIALDGGQAYLR